MEPGVEMVEYDEHVSSVMPTDTLAMKPESTAELSEVNRRVMSVLLLW